MTDNSEHDILFEVYKLHAELAEQTAASREGLNKLYTGMVSSVIVASVLLQRFAPGTETTWLLPSLGVSVSLCWMLSLNSLNGKLSAKHAVLLDLENKLPFAFFRQENEEFEKQGFIRRKWSSALMPTAFLLICLGWLYAVLARMFSLGAT